MSVFWTWTANKLTLLTLALSFDTDYRTPLVRMAGSIPWTNQFVLHHPILQLFLSRAHAALQLKTSKKPLNNWKTSATTADKLIKPINWFELLLPWVFKTVPEWNCYCIVFFPLDTPSPGFQSLLKRKLYKINIFSPEHIQRDGS